MYNNKPSNLPKIQVLTVHILRAGICGAHKCRILCKVLRPHHVQISRQYELKRCKCDYISSPAPGPLLTVQQPDQDPGCHRRGEEEHPGQPQPAQEARGQGGGARPAGGSQHEEDGDQTHLVTVTWTLSLLCRCGTRSWRPSPRGGPTSAAGRAVRMIKTETNWMELL